MEPSKERHEFRFVPAVGGLFDLSLANVLYPPYGTFLLPPVHLGWLVGANALHTVVLVIDAQRNNNSVRLQPHDKTCQSID